MQNSIGLIKLNFTYLLNYIRIICNLKRVWRQKYYLHLHSMKSMMHASLNKVGSKYRSMIINMNKNSFTLNIVGDLDCDFLNQTSSNL